MVNRGGGCKERYGSRFKTLFCLLRGETEKNREYPSQDTPVSHLRFFPFVSRIRTAKCHASRFVATGLGFLAKVFYIFQDRYVRMALRHILSPPPCFPSSRTKTTGL
jgi:hypothetical protein